MRRLRLCVATTLAWFLAVSALGRVDEALQLSLVGTVVAMLCALVLLTLPGLRGVSPVTLVACAVTGLVVVESALGATSAEVASVQLAAECIVVGVTLLLARWMSGQLQDFEAAVSDTMGAHLPSVPGSFDDFQGAGYGEIRRARSYNRPASLLAISVRPPSTHVLDHLVTRMQRESHERFVRAQLGALLSRELRDYDILATRDDYYVTLLPETRSEQAKDLVARLSAACESELGLELRIGLSSFPDHEVTYEKLLETASAAMLAEPASTPDALPEEHEAELAYDTPLQTASTAVASD